MATRCLIVSAVDSSISRITCSNCSSFLEYVNIKSDELLRLRNIKRNEARLVELGLAAPNKDKIQSKDKKFKSSKKDGGKKAADVEKRNVPPRHRKKDREEAAAVPKTSTKAKRKNQSETESTSKRHNSVDHKEVNKSKQTDTVPRDEPSLMIRGAKSSFQKYIGCQTDEKDSLNNHNKCCPSYRASQVAKNATVNFAERTPPPIRPNHQDNIRSLAAIANKSRSITPSPAFFAHGAPQPLPPYITEFLAQAVNDDAIPALRGAKWMPCPNPWGKVEQEEGDVVIFTPFQSESMVSVFHQDPNGAPPKRFAFKPMERNSSYLQSHRSPARGGYTVLRLTRDRTALIPWGFTVKHHEFGGACLVDRVDELSPAENAVSYCRF